MRSYALTAAGHVLAWGYNYWGGLGDGNFTGSDVPVPADLPATTRVAALSGGGDSSHVLVLAFPRS